MYATLQHILNVICLCFRYDKKFWIGLTDIDSEGTLTWSSGELWDPSKVPALVFEADDNPGDKDCVWVGPDGMKIESKDAEHGYICEIPGEGTSMPF